MSILNKFKKQIPLSVGIAVRSKLLSLKGLFYRGSQFECALCGHRYRKFLNGGTDLPVIHELQIIGAGKREQTICPGCHSNDRERLLHWYFEHEHPEISAKKILHIAPEPALGRYLQRKTDNYVGGVKYYEGFYYPPNVILLDVLDLPFPSKHFDLIICNHVLEHIDEDLLAMKALYDVLKPGGIAILQVPWSPLLSKTREDKSITSKADRERLFGQFDHVRVYGKDYPDRLRKAGFDVNIIYPKQLNLTKKELSQLAINPKECIFIASK
ncbi:MAG: methyltransferase domain-containing protein [Bacteroidetes bacterium]|nr:methyltransferase domain-containing protein [Bacteroidota bacterium]MBU1580007.1 methyltransferase domain-containing protein [Bacteroidota bacterium]MBU2556499.1 methyltransferase domain-containing protein [Bacteroidota bacterium]